MEGSISSVEDLSQGHTIKYGVMSGGSTEAFFRESNVTMYQKVTYKNPENKMPEHRNKRLY